VTSRLGGISRINRRRGRFEFELPSLADSPRRRFPPSLHACRRMARPLSIQSPAAACIESQIDSASKTLQSKSQSAVSLGSIRWAIREFTARLRRPLVSVGRYHQTVHCFMLNSRRTNSEATNPSVPDVTDCRQFTEIAGALQQAFAKDAIPQPIQPRLARTEDFPAPSASPQTLSMGAPLENPGSEVAKGQPGFTSMLLFGPQRITAS